MSISRIAVRYSRPLLVLAEEQKVLEAVKADMDNFNELCKSNRDFVLMLKSPIISHLKKAQILKTIFGSKVNELTMRFLELVARKNREKYLPEIAEEFIALYNAKLGYQEALVSTPITLDAEMRKSFEKMVSELTGKKPLLKEKVNLDLIGGFVLKLANQQIDESISGQLNDLKLKFKKETI